MQLKNARIAAGLTQRQLSELSRVDQQTISRLESGRVMRPSYETVVRLCRVLKVDPQAIAEFKVPTGDKR